jgi:hypothetical protein
MSLNKTKTPSTPGPWKWRCNTGTSPKLVTVGRGEIYIMGAARHGLNDATFTFQKHQADCDGQCDGCGRMLKAVNFGTPDYNGNYEINHPDARLIAAAPELLANLRELKRYINSYSVLSCEERQALYHNVMDVTDALLDRLENGDPPDVSK